MVNDFKHTASKRQALKRREDQRKIMYTILSQNLAS